MQRNVIWVFNGWVLIIFQLSVVDCICEQGYPRNNVVLHHLLQYFAATWSFQDPTKDYRYCIRVGGCSKQYWEIYVSHGVSATRYWKPRHCLKRCLWPEDSQTDSTLIHHFVQSIVQSRPRRPQIVLGAPLAGTAAALSDIPGVLSGEKNVQRRRTGLVWPNTALDCTCSNTALEGFNSCANFQSAWELTSDNFFDNVGFPWPLISSKRFTDISTQNVSIKRTAQGA